MMNKTTTVSHNNTTHEIKVGAWLKHLYSEPAEAVHAIHIDDIQLPGGKTAGRYKTEKKAEYTALAEKSGLSCKKYLNKCSLHDFGAEWDDFITLIKRRINGSCLPLLFARHDCSVEEQQCILAAASNGHIGAMYWIGTALRAREDDNCLLWLSMAHNRGHVGACYEMAAYLASKGNYLDSLRCLIISADGGFDVAYMSLFRIEILKSLLRIENIALLDEMLDELSGVSHSSSARYFKGMVCLLQQRNAEGAALLEEFMKTPKRQPPEDDVDAVYERQSRVGKAFIENVLRDTGSGMSLLNGICAHAEQAGFISFADYDEVVTSVQTVLTSE
jgi:hypothetical protein